jgi:hypothetical protein
MNSILGSLNICDDVFKLNRKLWDKLIAYFPFTTSIKKTSVYMHNEVNKTML